MKNEDLRPIYCELIGYFSQAPASEKSNAYIDDPTFWITINTVIDKINTITKDDYNRFKIIPQQGSGDYRFLNKDIYRQKLGGLISNIHAKYFNDESSPIQKKESNTYINQNQSVNVQILLDIQSKIDEKIKDYARDSKENKFLTKLKNCLSTTTNVIQLINQIIKIAKEFGLNLNDIFGIFK